MESEDLAELHSRESNLNNALHDEAPTSLSNSSALTTAEPPTLDHLVGLVGELVIASATANLLARKAGRPELAEANGAVALLVEQIRDATLQMRMIKIGDTLTVIRDACTEIATAESKQVDVAIRGGDTEVDKSVVSRIGEPLMHLVRHALTHSIEVPDLRTGLGKSPAGYIGLNAFHDSASIVIEVIDDGSGVDVSELLDDAVQRGVYPDGHVPTEDDVSDLIFEADAQRPRGLLMEVRRALDDLKGSVRITSEAGRGSKAVVRLPLTLAIVDGFLTVVGRSSFVLPLDAVVECMELPVGHSDRDYLNLRGEVLPFIRLRDLFQVSGAHPARENVIVVSHMGQRTGVVVDQLLGELQTVIKPLGSLFSHMRGIGGSTILGSGEVALILDVPALTKLSAGLERQHIGEPPPLASRAADSVAV